MSRHRLIRTLLAPSKTKMTVNVLILFDTLDFQIRELRVQVNHFWRNIIGYYRGYVLRDYFNTKQSKKQLAWITRWLKVHSFVKSGPKKLPSILDFISGKYNPWGKLTHLTGAFVVQTINVVMNEFKLLHGPERENSREHEIKLLKRLLLVCLEKFHLTFLLLQRD